MGVLLEQGEDLSASVLSGSSRWDLSTDGWYRSIELPAEAVVAGGAVYAGDQGYECL